MTPQPNPGDYVPLGGSIPQVTTPGKAGADKNGVATHGASIVQMQEEAWRLRAEAAAGAAEELTSCKLAVAQVLRHNYFGEGCVEGKAVYDALRAALTGESGWMGALASQILSLEHLAHSSKASQRALTTADSVNASKVDAVAT